MIYKINNLIEYIRGYCRYDLKRELSAWLHIALFFYPVLIGIIIFGLGAIFLLKPFPNEITYLAIGQQGSIADLIGREFVSYFQKQHLKLEIENTVGLEVGLQKLEDHGSRINASFLTAGTATSKDYPDLLSMGSVQIAPLWLFYRGKVVSVDDPFEFYRDRKIAVGMPGTVTNKLFNRLMEINNPGTGNRKNFLQLTHADAALKLKDGSIEAAFIVDGYHSPVIQSLLNDPAINLMNFPLADAYTRKLPFLEKIIVPKASVSISDIRPSRDITLLASSINLLIEKDVHPAIQWGLIMAAEESNFNSEHFFERSTIFPKYQDKSFPLSPVAQRYYKSGVPAIFNYLPLWFAALVENIWVILLALFLVIIPLISKVVGYRTLASQKLLWTHFWELRYLEDELAIAKNAQQIKCCLHNFERLSAEINSTWVKSSDMRHYYNLQRSLAGALEQAKIKLAEIEKP